MKWKSIVDTLWSSPEETKAERDADPDDLSVENAYKTRWIWYHTILGIGMFLNVVLLIAILLLLAIKL